MKARPRPSKPAGAPRSVAVYLEVGRKRVFAAALDWPGWCRAGRDEAAALEALFSYARRYTGALGTSRLGFRAPASPAAFRVVERLPGDATTDFGAPGAIPRTDTRKLGDAELRRLQRLLRACWRTFDEAAKGAAGRDLRKGPRGGGRDLEAIIRHVIEAESAYLGRMGFKPAPRGVAVDPPDIDRDRKHVLDCLEIAVRDGVPARGPRGGIRWSPRTFIRRDAWHLLDHAWEIEDRAGGD